MFDAILRVVSQASPFKRHIVVDMTPLEPGGQNGGAGVVAKSLVRHLSSLDPHSRFTLLTASDSHAELASLDADNVHRSCVVDRSSAPRLARELLERVLPPRVRVRVKGVYRSLRTSRPLRRVSADLQPDLIFFPFTVPTFWRPGVQCV